MWEGEGGGGGLAHAPCMRAGRHEYGYQRLAWCSSSRFTQKCNCQLPIVVMSPALEVFCCVEWKKDGGVVRGVSR